MIKNIIFDIGNVLIHFDWKGFLRKQNASQEDIRIVGEKAVHSPLWRTMDENKVHFNEIKQALKDAVGPQREHWIELMLDYYSGLCSTLPYTLPWLSSLKSRGYKIFVLSNFFFLTKKGNPSCFFSIVMYIISGILFHIASELAVSL